jgi:hypothetical protein
MKISVVKAKFFHADRRTGGQKYEMTKLIVGFRNFAKVPIKNKTFVECVVLYVCGQ